MSMDKPMNDSDIMFVYHVVIDNGLKVIETIYYASEHLLYPKHFEALRSAYKEDSFNDVFLKSIHFLGTATRREVRTELAKGKEHGTS